MKGNNFYRLEIFFIIPLENLLNKIFYRNLLRKIKT